MSKVTKPVVLDETAKQVVAQMQLQNEILTSLASGINYKPTSIKDVLNVVRAGQASKVFQVGDQIIVPWTDIATGQKYDVPLDIVAFGTSALQDGEELPSMTVQWHMLHRSGCSSISTRRFSMRQKDLLQERTILRLALHGVTKDIA